MRKIFVLLLSLALTAPPAALAQRGSRSAEKEKTKKETEEPAPKPQVDHVPYEDELGRLSEILGSMQYLRTLCGDPKGTTWRDDMSALIEAEAPTPERRARMVADFNRGYRSVSETHRRCTPAARLLIERYIAEGARLARDISARYGA